MGKIFFLLALCLFPSLLFADPVVQEKGFREALSPHTSLRQAKKQAGWNKQPHDYLNLGKACLYGSGTKKNAKKARKYLQKAAKTNQREAKLLLALMQSQGLGFKADPKQGFESVRFLAPDYPLAQYALSRLYEDGLGTPSDSAQALHWLTKAATAPVPVPQAQARLAVYYMHGYPPYISPEKEKAFHLMLSAAEAENAQAQHETALMYLHGTGTAKNEKRAFLFMRKAAQADITQAQIDLSNMYKEGIGTKADDYGAFSWMKTAAKQGNVLAQEQTALYYLRGFGTDASIQEALFWAQQARDNGSIQAENIIRQIKDTL